MRILVTGSRAWEDESQVVFVLAGESKFGTKLIHGDANGVDRIAARYARSQGWDVAAYPADWKKHGKAAGPIRNAQMVAAGADLCLAFPGPNSIGTWDCIRKAVAAGIPVRIYPERKR